MPLHHYLPASFLARFSLDSKEVPARDRFLVIGDKKTKKIFKARAGKVGCINNLYTLFDSPLDPNIVDQTWVGYEQRLPKAIEALIQGNVDAETWLRVLVPFVACMLVRAPDFVDKYYERFTFLDTDTLEKLVSSDVANKARLVDLQRLLGFVATAKWIVIASQATFITNDLGYSPFYNPINHDIGMALPLDDKNILLVIPLIKDHPILRAEGEKWMPLINYSTIANSMGVNYAQIHKGITNVANRFIFGTNEEIIKECLVSSIPSSMSIDPTNFGFPSGKFARAHEFTWHRLVTVISKSPSGRESLDFSIDIEAITSGWCSILFFPLNLVEFPPALKMVENVVWSNFYDPEIYYQISRIHELRNAGRLDDAVQEATNALSKKISVLLKSQILSMRGLILDDMGRNQEAIKDFEKATKLDRSNAILHLNFGYVLLKGNHVPRAYTAISKAIKLNPALGIAYTNRSVASWRMGRLMSAVEDSTTAVGLLPDGVDKANTLRNRGNILKQLGLEAQAKEDFIQANELIKKLPNGSDMKIE